MSPIFIPSKGRPNAKFIKLLTSAGLQATIVVEKEDQDDYVIANPGQHFLTLPQSGMGIAYVRNFIKNYTEDKGIKSFWMIDDDVNQVFERKATKMIKSSVEEVLALAEQRFIDRNYAQGALEYQQLAWSSEKIMAEDSYCDVAVWINNAETFGVRYHAHLEGKEDRDFTMQLIHAHKKVGRTTLEAFSAPSNGSNEGGLKEIFYDLEGREKLCAERMVEKWGHEVCRVVTKPSGRIDCKIDWKAINKPKQLKLF